MASTGKKKRWLFWGAVAAAAGVTALVVTGVLPLPGHGASNAKPGDAKAARAAPPAVAVTVAPVTLRPIQRKVSLVGTLHGQEEVTITPKVEGRVVQVLHDIGDRVRPGDLLLQIEDIDYRLAVEEAQKALELELAKLGLTKLPTGKVELEQLPTVARSRSLEGNTQVKLRRAQRLRTGGATAQEELDPGRVGLQGGQGRVGSGPYGGPGDARLGALPPGGAGDRQAEVA